jgi:hypothetical protein
LAQKDNAGEAAAQAAAAFVQQPANNSVQWHFGFAAQKAGFAPGALAPFLNPGPRQSLALMTSAPHWQLLMIVAAFIAAAAISWMLVNAYGPRRRFEYWTASTVLVFSIALAGTATAGVQTYGITADEHAVMVVRAGILRSIPTEADTTQKTTPVGPGTLGLMDRSFLGWRHLQFDNGQTGWVRVEEIVPLWQ